MTVKQALKKKQKLIAEIAEQYNIARNHNSSIAGNPKRFSVADCLTKAENLTNELVALKAKIHRANTPVYDSIFLMAELKGVVKQLRGIPTDEGTISGRYGGTPEVKEVQITEPDLKAMIAKIESRIETLQEALDTHNATTTI